MFFNAGTSHLSYAVDPFTGTDTENYPTLISFGDNTEFDVQSQFYKAVVCVALPVRQYGYSTWR